jgi:hypothetical protein
MDILYSEANLSYNVTSLKVAGSSPDEVDIFFN